jgi:cytosine/adenosine deaminase-related metal-dependent hydrolase
MNFEYEILLKNGKVVDPVNQRNGVLDVAVSGGKIARIEKDIQPTTARECIDVQGDFVIPGIIDPHVHASPWLGGGYAHKMLALAGVTTALDMSGPVKEVLEMAAANGTGLNLACIQYVRPGHTVSGPDPNRTELEDLLQRSMKAGAIGFKILGGHYPLTPEATARAIEVVARQGAYVAFHAGTLAPEAKSNLEGLKEALDLAQGHPFHLAHVNSYCRGLIKPYMLETEEAIRALETHLNVCSESYLSPLNGTSAQCSEGVPESKVTGIWLSKGGFPRTEQGMEQAILAGWALINLPAGGEMVLSAGKEALAYWRGRNTDATVSFNVNPPGPRLRLATAKRASGEFAVDCFGTDGGGIPRNVIVSMGLSLVKLQALSMEEFVIKSSRNPSRMLGLTQKGHLGIGSDADITVVNLERQTPVMSISNGKIIMYKGYVCCTGTRFITTPAGVNAVKASGVEPLVIDLSDRPFFRMMH